MTKKQRLKLDIKVVLLENIANSQVIWNFAEKLYNNCCLQKLLNAYCYFEHFTQVIFRRLH